MQLNGFKRYGKVYKFAEGDIIRLSDDMGFYMPQTQASKDQMKYGDWRRNTSEDINLNIRNLLLKSPDVFDNIKLKERDGRFMNFVVLSVNDNDPLFKPAEALVDEDDMPLELHRLTLTAKGFRHKSAEVLRVTDKTVVMKNDSLTYKTTINKSEIDVTTSDHWRFNNPLNPTYSRICWLKDFDETRDILMTEMSEAIERLNEAAKNLTNTIETIKKEQGY